MKRSSSRFVSGVSAARGPIIWGWNPALKIRVPARRKNPSWFAPTGGGHGEPSRGDISYGESRLRLAENQNESRRSDTGLTSEGRGTLPPARHMSEPAEV
jgi:hypothetical protein